MAGEGGEACTMLVRTLHWVVPSYSIWGLPFFLFYSTRLAQFLYERPGQGFLRSMLCRLMTPLVWKKPLYILLPPDLMTEWKQTNRMHACEHQDY